VAYSQKCKTSQILLGVANYYRRFIERYAQRSVAFRELLAKDKPFVWGKAQEKAFNYLKLTLSSPPILKFTDTNGDY